MYSVQQPPGEESLIPVRLGMCICSGATHSIKELLTLGAAKLYRTSYQIYALYGMYYTVYDLRISNKNISCRYFVYMQSPCIFSMANLVGVFRAIVQIYDTN
uniref:Uncharacterized protein n=1 Tax=Glossina pallidipes TaxID=7398 RepID=A0A1B0AAI3_GLOPL